jgi:DNA-binding beta-propeller fold protein YncE
MRWPATSPAIPGICSLPVVLFSALLTGAPAPLSNTAPLTASNQAAEKASSPRLTFVREFSSAQDVDREMHPVLNRAIDIIAGPKEDEAAAGNVLQRPYAVTTDPTHRVFVTDVSTGTVHVFDFVHSKYSLLHGGEHLRSPLGVAADGDGNVYVSDSTLRTVLVYDSKGKFKHYLKSARGSESYFDSPRGIAVDAATERIYVCDMPRHMVIKLDRKGRVLARFGKRGGGGGPGEFRYPTQVAVSGDEIVVYDSGNFRVQILDMQGRLRQEIRIADATNSAGVAVDKEGTIYVSDPQLDQIRVFSRNGQPLYEFGQVGTAPGQFNGISGIWVDSGHCLQVVDSQNKRVQVFEINGLGNGECP